MIWSILTDLFIFYYKITSISLKLLKIKQFIKDANK